MPNDFLDKLIILQRPASISHGYPEEGHNSENVDAIPQGTTNVIEGTSVYNSLLGRPRVIWELRDLSLFANNIDHPPDYAAETERNFHYPEQLKEMLMPPTFDQYERFWHDGYEIRRPENMNSIIWSQMWSLYHTIMLVVFEMAIQLPNYDVDNRINEVINRFIPESRATFVQNWVESIRENRVQSEEYAPFGVRRSATMPFEDTIFSRGNTSGHHTETWGGDGPNNRTKDSESDFSSNSDIEEEQTIWKRLWEEHAGMMQAIQFILDDCAVNYLEMDKSRRLAKLNVEMTERIRNVLISMPELDHTESLYIWRWANELLVCASTKGEPLPWKFGPGVTNVTNELRELGKERPYKVLTQRLR